MKNPLSCRIVIIFSLCYHKRKKYVGKEVREIIDTKGLKSSCFNGSYKELVDLIGHDNTLILYENYAGQYLSLPKKLIAEEYLHKLILSEYDGTNAKKLARKYGYTYSWIQKILKKLKEVEAEEKIT